jgi:hypothetical protein
MFIITVIITIVIIASRTEAKNRLLLVQTVSIQPLLLVTSCAYRFGIQAVTHHQLICGRQMSAVCINNQICPYLQMLVIFIHNDLLLIIVGCRTIVSTRSTH